MEIPSTADLNNNTKPKKGFRQKLSEMIRSSPKSQKPLKSGKLSLENGSTVQNISPEEFEGGRTRSQSVRSRLKYRRRQSSLSTKELEKIALKYKKQEKNGRPLSQVSSSIEELHGACKNSLSTSLTDNSLKYKTWSSLPHVLLDSNTDVSCDNEDEDVFDFRKDASPKAIPIHLRKDLFNPNSSDAVDIDHVDSKEVSDNHSKRIFKKQRSLYKNKRQNQHKKLCKSFSSDATMIGASLIAELETRVHETDVRKIIENEIESVISDKKYDELLVQKWSKDICTQVRDQIRSKTGKQYKVLVNALIGSIDQTNRENRETAGVCIQNCIQKEDCFVLSAMENEDLFISVWALISQS